MTGHAVVVCALLLCTSATATADPAKIRWKQLQAGVVYAALSTAGAAAAKRHRVRDDRLHVVRIDPTRARLVALVASQLRVKNMTAAQWARRYKLVAAINLGMFKSDYSTHVGYLRVKQHVNSRAWLKDYKSVLAFGLRRKATAPVAVVDLGARTDHKRLAQYRVVAQNLRLIKHSPGSAPRNVWTKQKKRWSEAAVALDKKGRLLFLFTRLPLTMWEFNHFVLGLRLGIVRAMHMDGGPPASLSIRAKGLTLDLAGSFETGVTKSDANLGQWKLPNMLGVVRAR